MSELEKFGCQEDLSGGARLARLSIGEGVESIYGEAYRIDNPVYIDDNFGEEEQNYIAERIEKLSGEMKEQLEKVGISDSELIENLTGSVVSLVLTDKETLYFGSGGFIRPNVIVTNAHVVRKSDNGQIHFMKMLVDGDGNTYTPRAIYFNKLCTSDVAFIVTQEESEDYVDKNNRDGVGGDIITLGTPKLRPDFQSHNDSSTLGPRIQRWASSFYEFDSNNNNIPESEEFEHANNHIKPGHSGGLVVSPTGVLEGIITRGTSNPERNTGVEYTGMQDIHREFIDFVNSMTKLSVHVK